MPQTLFESDNPVIDAVFHACVRLLLEIGYMTGCSYYTVNVVIFCVIWPLLTLSLIAAVIILARKKCTET